MDAATELLKRNERSPRATRGAAFIPKLSALILTCADHRVDPAHVLGLELGEAVIIRNGGRPRHPRLRFRTWRCLRRSASPDPNPPEHFELILMQHTDCGVGRLMADHTDALAAYFGVTPEEVPAQSPDDPYEGIRVDMEKLASNPLVPGSLTVSGFVYDVKTGRAELVEQRSPLRDDA